MAEGKNNALSETVAGLVVLGFLGWAVWSGVSYISDLLKEHPAAATPDPRDEQIKQLTARIEQLETKPADPHYELRQDGLRTFRFDPRTGNTCIQLTTKEDWKRPETIRQGCEYQDWALGDGASYKDYLNAECQLVHVKKSCDQFIAMVANKP